MGYTTLLGLLCSHACVLAAVESEQVCSCASGLFACHRLSIAVIRASLWLSCHVVKVILCECEQHCIG